MYDDSKQTAKTKIGHRLGPRKSVIIEAGPEGFVPISVLLNGF